MAVQNSDFVNFISIFIQHALIKIENGTFDEDDLKRLMLFTQHMLEIKKEYDTPPVYWDLRKG